MGIQIGKSNPKPFTADAVFALHNAKQKPTYTEDERKALVASLMRLPKDKVVPALRSAGLDAEADELEQKMAQSHLVELRKEKVTEIMKLSEGERVAALLDAGFNEEAAAESKRQAESQLWSAVVSLLDKYGVIQISDEQTHSVLEQASNEAITTAERVLFCNENGLEVLGKYYTAAISGTALDDIETELKAESVRVASEKEGVGEGGEVAAAETGAAEEAVVVEKKKAGRPKKNA